MGGAASQKREPLATTKKKKKKERTRITSRDTQTSRTSFQGLYIAFNKTPENPRSRKTGLHQRSHQAGQKKGEEKKNGVKSPIKTLASSEEK